MLPYSAAGMITSGAREAAAAASPMVASAMLIEDGVRYASGAVGQTAGFTQQRARIVSRTSAAPESGRSQALTMGLYPHYSQCCEPAMAEGVGNRFPDKRFPQVVTVAEAPGPLRFTQSTHANLLLLSALLFSVQGVNKAKLPSA